MVRAMAASYGNSDIRGDFTLMNSGQVDTNPADWFYAQHGPSFVGKGNAGIFNLALMDNGDNRIFSPGVTCGTGSAPPCSYSTVPIFQINESKMTASFTFHQIIPASLYNAWGGNAEVLPNGNVHYDLSAVLNGIGNLNSYFPPRCSVLC